MRTLHRTLRPALLAAVLAGLAAAAAPARAGTVEMSGGRLQLITTGDNGASIETDTGLNGAVRVVGDDLSCMQIHNGSSIEVNTAGCGDGLGHLTVMVPSGFPVDLTMRGSGDVHIGDLHGPLNATIDADGALTAGALNVLHLVMHGSGDATVAAANGATDIEDFGSGEVKLSDLHGVIHAEMNGSGDLSIGSIAVSAAALTTAGSGDISVGDGNIDMLHASTNGSGDISVKARVGTAELQASGGGDIRLSGQTGTVIKREASGGSDISVGPGAVDVDQFKGIAEQARLQALKGLSINIHDDAWPHTTRDDGFSVGHIIAGICVLALLFFLWRTVQRHGGIGRVAARVNAPTEPTHPGVLAVRDTLMRLDTRLAQVEYYVTSREFDLHKKFRELDARK